MIGGVGLGVEEEVCSAIKGDISPLFCCDEEKKIDNHATFKPCIVLDCHSLLPKQASSCSSRRRTPANVHQLGESGKNEAKHWLDVCLKFLVKRLFYLGPKLTVPRFARNCRNFFGDENN